MQPLKQSRNSKIKVLLIENGQIMRAGLRLIIEKNNVMKIVGEMENPSQFTESGEKPDVILFSPLSNCLNGIERVVEIRENLPEAKVLLLVKGGNSLALQRAVMLGVTGIVYQEQSPETLVRAIECVSSGEIWIDRVLMAQALGDFTVAKLEKRDREKQKADSLTPKEKQVVGSIGEGLRNKEIAVKLRISEATVRHHLSSIFGKLEVYDRLSLAIYAFRQGLADLPRKNDC